MLRELMAAAAGRMDASAETVVRGLADRASVVVETAAKAAVHFGGGVEGIRDALTAALDRMLGEPKDPSSAATVALLDAMRSLRIIDRDLFRRCLFCERTEPTYGGSIDSGAAVRAAACAALVESGDASASLLLTAVLFERHASPRVEDHPTARIEAARGLGLVGDVDAVIALRIKLTRSHSDAPEVIGECCGALVRLDPGNARGLIRSGLAHQPAEAVEAAVLAVGETRQAAAVGVLEDLRQQLAMEGIEEAAMIGFALVRQTEATDILLERLAQGPMSVRIAAARALHLLRNEADIPRRVEETVAADPDARTLFGAFSEG